MGLSFLVAKQRLLDRRVDYASPRMRFYFFYFVYLFRVDNKLYWQLKSVPLCPHHQHLVSASSGPLKCRKGVSEPWSLMSPNMLKITMLSSGETQTFLSVQSGDGVPAAVLVSSIWGFSLWKDNACMWLQLSHIQSAALSWWEYS